MLLMNNCINKCLHKNFGVGSWQHITVIRDILKIDLVEEIISNRYDKFLDRLYIASLCLRLQETLNLCIIVQYMYFVRQGTGLAFLVDVVTVCFAICFSSYNCVIVLLCCCLTAVMAK